MLPPVSMTRKPAYEPNTASIPSPVSMPSPSQLLKYWHIITAQQNSSKADSGKWHNFIKIIIKKLIVKGFYHLLIIKYIMYIVDSKLHRHWFGKVISPGILVSISFNNFIALYHQHPDTCTVSMRILLFTLIRLNLPIPTKQLVHVI